ncbi:MAG TPA: DUF309 domain-containing protein [Blastocatellia bacterium]|nr:DUF309 domain-containing protein [Blastocatellia bacterium]
MPDRTAMPYLRFESGPQAGERLALDKPKLIFGRHLSCDCVLSHPTVSRQHFCIERMSGKYFLVDQESNNGTFANGERVSWVELKNGDRIQAGPFIWTVELPEEQERMRDNPAGENGAALEAPERSGFDAGHEQIYPREYLEGIAHFNARRYYEAHEVWEEIWLRSSEETKLFYQMLIQAAVGLHHYERGNYRGGRGMHKAVTEKLRRLPSVYMSLDLADFSRQFKSFFAELIEKGNESPPLAERARPFIRLLRADLSDLNRA